MITNGGELTTIGMTSPAAVDVNKLLNVEFCLVKCEETPAKTEADDCARPNDRNARVDMVDNGGGIKGDSVDSGIQTSSGGSVLVKTEYDNVFKREGEVVRTAVQNPGPGTGTHTSKVILLRLVSLLDGDGTLHSFHVFSRISFWSSHQGSLCELFHFSLLRLQELLELLKLVENELTNCETKLQDENDKRKKYKVRHALPLKGDHLKVNCTQ